MNLLFGWFFRLFNKIFDSRHDGYAERRERIVPAGGDRAGALWRAALAHGAGFQECAHRFMPIQDTGLPDRLCAVAGWRQPGAHAEGHHRRPARSRARMPGVIATVEFPGFTLLSGPTCRTRARCSFRSMTFEQRKDPSKAANAIMGQIYAQVLAELRRRACWCFRRRRWSGLGNSGGFKMMIQDRTYARARSRSRARPSA